MTVTSSIGPQWPPRHASHHRIKGIDNRGIIVSGGHLLGLLATLEPLCGRLVHGRQPDRVSVRALITDEVLRDRLELLAPLIEVAIPLRGDFDHIWLVYLGANGPGRQSEPDELAIATGNVDTAAQRARSSCRECLERPVREGYRLTELTYASRQRNAVLQEQMTDLYGRFGWSFAQVGEILQDPNNLIAVAFADDRPVSAGIAELSAIHFSDGNTLRVAELTEASTLEDHRGHGLYTGVAATLMTAVAQRSATGEFLGGAVDLVFGECSGYDPGVLHASQRLGRTFARVAAREHGLDFPGFLSQHVPIAGGAARKSRYHDLFPSFIVRADLEAFVVS
ncbi:MAG: hypothetical protein AAGD38_12990 [Acidobacteriota bacterium]